MLLNRGLQVQIAEAAFWQIRTSNIQVACLPAACKSMREFTLKFLTLKYLAIMQMTYVQAISGGGGWPMSVFLTPTLEPIVGESQSMTNL